VNADANVRKPDLTTKEVTLNRGHAKSQGDEKGSNVQTRRHFLKRSALTGLGLLFSDTIKRSPVRASPSLPQPFVDPLPIPDVLKPSGQIEGVTHYELSLGQFAQELH
jgi:hypothetical protein